jgi:hypothetical protein
MTDTDTVMDEMIKEKNRDVKLLSLSLILKAFGYLILIAIDWRVAIAIFLIHLSIGIDRNVMKHGIAWGIALSGKIRQ